MNIRNLNDRVVAVAIPTMSGQINVDLTGALMSAASSLRSRHANMGMMYISGCSIIATARNRLVRAFLQESNATDLFFIDDDIILSAYDMLRLVSQATDEDIVAAAYLTRQDDPKFMIRLGNQTEPDETDMIAVERVPCGAMVIRRHVMETLWEATKDGAYKDDDRVLHPVFGHTGADGGYVGEDYHFCDLVRSHGFTIKVDPYVITGHIHQRVNYGRLIDSLGNAQEQGQGKSQEGDGGVQAGIA